MIELLKCFLYGFAALAVLGLIAYATWVFFPYSSYAWAGLFFCGACIGLGCDMRSGIGPR